jgi:hypothetical protein
LLATALSSTPMWRSFDPLPVLDSAERFNSSDCKRGKTEREAINDEERDLAKVFG